MKRTLPVVGHSPFMATLPSLPTRFRVPLPRSILLPSIRPGNSFSRLCGRITPPRRHCWYWRRLHPCRRIAKGPHAAKYARRWYHQPTAMDHQRGRIPWSNLFIDMNQDSRSTSSSDRDHLALVRTDLANERTLLAYGRTGLMVLGFGSHTHQVLQRFDGDDHGGLGA